MNVVVERVAVVVVDHVLVEHAADALHDAAGDLALDDHRVDHHAAVLADDVAQDRRPTRSSASTSTMQAWQAFDERHRRRQVAGADLEPGLHARRQALGLRCRRRSRDLGDRLTRVRGRRRRETTPSSSSRSSGAASSRCAAICERPSRASAGRRLLRRTGRDRRRCGCRRCPAPSGATRGVALDDDDVVQGDAELVGDDLRHRRLDALPVTGRAHDHRDRAGRDRRGPSRPSLAIEPDAACGRLDVAG